MYTIDIHHVLQKLVPDMTYNVLSGTLDPTQSIKQNVNCKILVLLHHVA